MAFVHHQPRQQRRERQGHVPDSVSTTYASAQHRHDREVPQDWSIVFPGRSREAPPSPTLQHASSITRRPSSLASSSTDHSDDSDPLALTLPPLHDGTGRFLASPLSPSSTDAASVDAAPQHSGADDDRLSDARHSEDVFPESVFSGTDSQLDADEELGFGSGSDFDFESDAAASSHPSRSSARRGALRTASRRRPSKLSHVSIGSDDDEISEAARSQSHSHMLGSKAWSLLGRSNALERVPESPSASTQLYSSARSSRQMGRSRRLGNDLAVVFTSGSEREDNDGHDLDRSRDTARHDADAAFDADLAVSNLAQSAGLSHLEHSDLLRRPKRRHRRSAAGRSSKRSNTSQSLLSIDYESRLLTGHHRHQADGHRHADGAETPRSSTQASRMVQEHPSKTTRVIGTILRKVFDLEPEVLEAFLQEDAERQQRSGAQNNTARTSSRPGFAFEAAEAPLACAPLCDAAAAATASSSSSSSTMMLDGRSEHERVQSSSDDQTEVEERGSIALDPSTSPLFSNSKPVEGEEMGDTSGLRLTEAALLQRGSVSTRRASGSSSLMEPTTMEALSAFMNTMVMPVPMPLRLLGALFGWSSIWSSSASKVGSEERDAAATTATMGEQEEDEAAKRDAEEERRYRYERLLSAQQAKAWSRRYRGILFANVDDEEPSPDVPELWRGEEHPAIAGQRDV
ncbi:hypothetical protein PHSY_005926 [Pseudozyma hubeiensis SY62]|uniref:Uncharacterized protein n=1 Tax=Pseudozyma hubeiensis (strain SY62) TaxID=1305764 RepID=R9PAE1_PSEHS|nr:hypothetical protein PHSY_005926 [Pseudozyma hubeiensis SY62]GAC98333.1 hypothetical protein PHSY_005926 [Pseudozyma hubeiensis SY62]